MLRATLTVLLFCACAGGSHQSPRDAAADATALAVDATNADTAVTDDAAFGDGASPPLNPCTGDVGVYGDSFDDIVEIACAMAADGGEAAVFLDADIGCGEMRVETLFHHGSETLIFDADGTVLRWVWGDGFSGTGGSCTNAPPQCTTFTTRCTVCAAPVHHATGNLAPPCKPDRDAGT